MKERTSLDHQLSSLSGNHVQNTSGILYKMSLTVLDDVLFNLLVVGQPDGLNCQMQDRTPA